MRSVNQMFRLMLAVVMLPALLLCYSLHKLGVVSDYLTEVNDNRYHSFLLAQELRQSSDDLTRLARTYVVTGDPEWEKQYFEILDIRNGVIPRPKDYDKIYWDFRSAGQNPNRGVGEKVALTKLMQRSGFSEEEFSKLKEAQANSNELVSTETFAMNLIKGQFADGKGGYTIKGEPDTMKARSLMHDKNYHLYKAKIMKPVDEFLYLLDDRTSKEVAVAIESKNFWYWTLVLSIAATVLVVMLSLLLIVRSIMTRFGADPMVVFDSVDAMKNGDLVAETPLSQGDTSSVMVALKGLRSQFRRVVTDVRGGARAVAIAAKEIAQGNQDLSDRVEKQAGALEQTASSMEQLGTQVKQNAEHAREANRLAMSASSVAVEGGVVVSEVVATMKGINDSSHKISDIISVIDGIAFQTNILALNAAVEAARAGEQGRGFAVVASEVRALAGRSADAAKEIKTLISASVERVELGSILVDKAGVTMTEVVQSIQRVTEIMGEISVASNEQSIGVLQVADAVTQMDQVTQQNAALVEQMAAAAASLRTQANELVSVVDVFKVLEK